MDTKMRSETMDFLYDAILSLDSKEKCYEFFDDLCTVKELQSMAQRIEVARLLKSNRTYVEIAEKTGASTVTISRVNRILQYGNKCLSQVLDDHME